MDRRTFLKGAIMTGAGMMLPAAEIPFVRAAGTSQASKSPITIYGVHSMSGIGATSGKIGRMGLKLVCRDYGPILGRHAVATTLDTHSEASTAVRKVQGAHEGDLFVGCVFSNVALAVGQEVDKRGGVLFTAAGADEITGKDCNAGTYRWSVPTYGAVRETLLPLIKAHSKFKRFYCITPKYVFGESLLANCKQIFKETGVEFVGNSYHSTQTTEFSSYLGNAMAAKPDVLVLNNFAVQATDCLRQAVNFGLKKRMTILLIWALGLPQYQALGSDVLDGVYVGCQYWHQADTPMNKRIIKNVHAAYGIDPDYIMAANYTMGDVILQAIAKAGTTHGTAVRKAIDGMKYEGPTGEEQVRAQDHQVIKNYYLLRGKPKSKKKNKNDYLDFIHAGKSFRSEKDDMCGMA